MLLNPGDVLRRHVRYFPASTTTVNVDRLPDERALATMELRYREEPPNFEAGHVRLRSWIPAFVTVGFTYVWTIICAPSLAFSAWSSIQSLDGFPVIAGMLFTMLGGSILLAVCLLPTKLQALIMIVSGVGGIASAVAWVGGPQGVSWLSPVLSIAAVLLWQNSLLKFHAEWLGCEHGFRQDQTVKASRIGSSNLNVLGNGLRLLYRYLNYQSLRSGAAGVWVPSQSSGVRVLYLGLAASWMFISIPIPMRFSFRAWILGLVGSAALFLLVLVLSFHRIDKLSRAYDSKQQIEESTWWQRHVDKLRYSKHTAIDPLNGGLVREAEHLFLGVEPWLNFPILLHQPILYDHTYIVGRTGSGKTSIGLMQFLIQILRGHQLADTAAPGETAQRTWSEKTPTIVIDLKGDPVLFQTAKEEAERRGQKFRFFTLEAGKASYKFNPFSGFHSGTRRSLPQLVQLVLDSLSLNHGAGYGRSYYSQRSRFMLSEILRSSKAINNFKDLYKALNDMYQEKKSDFRDCFELISVIESLTHYDQLVTTAAQDKDELADTIQMSRVLEEREVVYFWLPSAMESVSVREVGKLVLFNLRTAAQDRQNQRKELRRAFLIIDECQKLAGENFQEVLQQARSGGIAAILANQSLSDLKTPDCDLRPTIRTNTRVKMYFSMSEPEDIRTISDFSGQELQLEPNQETETIRPRLSTQDILSISDHPQQLLLQVNGGSGYTQFGGLLVPVQTDWPILKSVADERDQRPWPTLASAAPDVLVTATVPPEEVHQTVRTRAKKNYNQKIQGMMH